MENELEIPRPLTRTYGPTSPGGRGARPTTSHGAKFIPSRKPVRSLSLVFPFGYNAGSLTNTPHLRFSPPYGSSHPFLCFLVGGTGGFDVSLLLGSTNRSRRRIVDRFELERRLILVWLAISNSPRTHSSRRGHHRRHNNGRGCDHRSERSARPMADSTAGRNIFSNGLVRAHLRHLRNGSGPGWLVVH